MSHRNNTLVAVTILTPLLVAAAFPFVTGCSFGLGMYNNMLEKRGQAPLKVVTNRSTSGNVTRTEYDDGKITYRRGGGAEYSSPSVEFRELERDFNNSNKATQTAMQNAGRTTAENGKPPATSPLIQPITPKVDLPTQHTTTITHPPSPPPTPTPTPMPAYTPPRGVESHPH